MIISNKIILRFFDKILMVKNDCWIWKPIKTRYPFIQNGKKLVSAHVLSYVYFKGKIPKGLVVDHECDNTKCVNPSHLVAKTQRANVLRSRGLAAIYAKKTHCLRGHELSGENVYERKDKRGRECKTCVRDAQKRFRQKNV